MAADSGQALVTSQRWKLWVWGIAVAVVVVCLLVPRPIAALAGIESEALTLIASFGALLILIGAALAVTCPACRLSLVWYALSKQQHTSWILWLLDVTNCPRCGHSHSDPQK